ncbi:MAG TPA: trypsin-like peptidase domain-containing protein [Phycisphaerae bacterium]|nr:trypsin-like peptidase domain-containing protein [Phycisphaerae bacterium]
MLTIREGALAGRKRESSAGHWALIFFLVFGAGNVRGFDNPAPLHFPPELSEVDRAALGELDRLSRAFSLIANAVKPSVVSIRAATVNREVNNELKKLFGDQEFQPVPTTGAGSGVILDEEGHIVTNNHVVADADVVRVKLADGREFRARVVGTDAMTDVAVIKIDAGRLHPARFGDSDMAEVGNIVLAIGSPFKFGHSVSHGIISATGRNEVDVDIDYKNWLQTDAPINPGNSGGPLINTRGEVIGLSVAIATDSGGHQGVGFAIPSNTVVRIAGQLKSGKKVVRGFLGVEIQPVDGKTANAYGLVELSGALISHVGEKTPAESGGLRAEDIVLSYNGKAVANHDQFKEVIALTAPGTEVVLNVWRSGSAGDLRVTIGEQPPDFTPSGSLRTSRRIRPSQAEARETADPSEPVVEKSLSVETLGLEVRNVTKRLAKRFRLDREDISGVIITQVDPTGEAYNADLKAGQLIVRANDQPVQDVDELGKILTQDALAKGVRLRVATGSTEFFAVLGTE